MLNVTVLGAIVRKNHVILQYKNLKTRKSFQLNSYHMFF